MFFGLKNLYALEAENEAFFIEVRRPGPSRPKSTKHGDEVRRLGPSRPPQNSPKIPEKKCFLCRLAN